MGFLPFGFFVGIGHDAAAALHIQGLVFNHGGADGDGQVHIVVEAPATCRAAIDAAFGRLQLFDDFQRANFWGAGECAGREGGGEHVHIRYAGFQTAFDIGNDVHHMRIALNHHFFGNADAAGFAHAADIVAAQINQHHVFGDFFGIAEQILLLRQIFGGGFAAQAGAGNGAHDDVVALAPHQNLGRGADHMEIAEIVVKHIGRGVERAQGAVEAERVVAEFQLHALAGHDLHAVAVEDVLADFAYIFFVTRFAGFVFRLGGGAAERERDGAALAQLDAQFFQTLTGVLVAVGFGGIGIHNQVDFAAEIIDYGQFLRQHQQDVGRADGVGLIGLLEAVGEMLEMVDGFVAEIAD